MAADPWWVRQSSWSWNWYKFTNSPCVTYALPYESLIPPERRPRPDLCVMFPVFGTVYSKLRLCLDKCSHEDALSSHSRVLMRRPDGCDAPEGRHRSGAWWIPANCPPSDRELWVTLSVSRCWTVKYCFPWQTCSAHQAGRPCSCTQTLNNGMPVLPVTEKVGYPPPFFFFSPRVQGMM